MRRGSSIEQSNRNLVLHFHHVVQLRGWFHDLPRHCFVGSDSAEGAAWIDEGGVGVVDAGVAY